MDRRTSRPAAAHREKLPLFALAAASSVITVVVQQARRRHHRSGHAAGRPARIANALVA
jgi:hypothetical protein